MAGPNPSFDTLLSLTFDRVRGILVDNFTTHSVLMASIRNAGGVKEEEGGYALRETITYRANSTVKSFGPYETFDTTPQEVVTTAVYNWKYLVGTATVNEQEVFQNSGPGQIANLITAKINQLDASFQEVVDDQSVADGSGSGGKDLGGLALLVEDGAAWSTVAGIDSNANAFWRNQYTNFTGAGFTSFSTAAGGSCEGMKAMRAMYNLTERKKDRTNLILTTSNVKDAYEAWAEGQKLRITSNQKLVDMGFDNVEFKGIPIVRDDNIPTNYQWWLNTKWLNFVIGRGFNFKGSDWMKPVDQAARVKNVLLFANFTCSNRARQGLIVNFVP